MTAKEKVCKQCKHIFSGSKCPLCGSEDIVDNYKGKVVILNSENSEIARNMKIKNKGPFAIKT